MQPLPVLTPATIKATRQAACLTLASAAALIHVTLDAWAKWESGARPMHPAYWELFLLKIGVLTLSPDRPERVMQPADGQGHDSV